MSNLERKTLGEIIKDDLKEGGWNQSAVAKKMNVSKQVINQIDRRKYFDLGFLQKLKDSTGLDYTGYIQTRSYMSADENLAEHQATPAEQVEMSLTIKIKSNPELINKVGELLMTIRREAFKLGFTVQ